MKKVLFGLFFATSFFFSPIMGSFGQLGNENDKIFLPRVSQRRIEREERIFEQTITREKRKCYLFGGVLLASNIAHMIPFFMLLLGKKNPAAPSNVENVVQEKVDIGWLAWMYGGIKNFFISKELWQLIVSGLSVKMLGDIVDMYKPYFFLDQITFFVAVRAPYTKYITVASQEALLLETMDLGTSYKKTKQMLINDLSMIVMSVEQLLMFMLYENKKNAMQSQVLDDMSNYLKNSLDTWTDAIEKELQAFPFPSARVVTLLQELKIDIDHVIAQILDLQRMKKIQKARKIST